MFRTRRARPTRATTMPGTGGIALSSWINRAAFALELGSKALLLSDDITSESRLLLHRDLGDRLAHAGSVHPVGQPPGAASFERANRIPRSGLHHERELSLCATRRPRGISVSYARAVSARDRRRVHRPYRSLPQRRDRPHRPRLVRNFPDSLSAQGRDSRGGPRSPEVPGRPLRDAGRGLRTVPRHAARPLRERVRRVVQADQPLRARSRLRETSISTSRTRTTSGRS